MSSELEQVAESVRALTSSATSVEVSLREVAGTAGGLVSTAAALGAQGADTRALVGNLDAATRAIEDAAAQLAAFRQQADTVARRLAGGGGAAGVMVHALHTVQGLAVTVAMVSQVLTPAWDALVAINHLDNGDPKDATQLVERAAAGGDITDAVRDPDYEPPPQVKDPPYGDHRPPP